MGTRDQSPPRNVARNEGAPDIVDAPLSVHPWQRLRGDVIKDAVRRVSESWGMRLDTVRQCTVKRRPLWTPNELSTACTILFGIVRPTVDLPAG